MVDKIGDNLLMFCNECNWKEETIGLKYEICPVCGHVNIGFSKNNNENSTKKEVN